LHQPGFNELSVDESPCELLVCNVAVFDIPERNKKETTAGGTDQFETLLGVFNSFHVVIHSREDYDSRAVVLVATSACSGLGCSHDDPFNHW
jgi:hypothetical protein